MDKVMMAGILSYGFYAFFVIFAIIALMKGDRFLMTDNIEEIKPFEDGEPVAANAGEVSTTGNLIDTSSGLEIKLTDNTPKEDDDFQKADQYNRPMTEDEIKAKIEELI